VGGQDLAPHQPAHVNAEDGDGIAATVHGEQQTVPAVKGE
jgi:hypothetical protein